MGLSLLLPKPDDAHIHLRDGTALSVTVPHAARAFSRAVVMPNLDPPVVNVAQMDAYYARILAAVPAGLTFEPLMTLYAQADFSELLLLEAQSRPYFLGVKLYPKGVTTHSSQGIASLAAFEPVLGHLEKLGIPLLIHGEVSDAHVDVFDRELRFIDDVLEPWVRRFPGLRISLEHITSAYAVQYITSCREGVGASITAHHLLMNRNDLLSGGIKPDWYCLPVAKRSTDQHALLQALLSANPRFYLGTDSAPHPRTQKYTACGCAGIYTAHAALAYYATALQTVNGVHVLPELLGNMARFYGLPASTQQVRLTDNPTVIPSAINYPAADNVRAPTGDVLTPFWAGRTLPFAVENA